MQCAQLIDIILVIGRVVVLILGMFSGVITIYLGWRLYKDSIISKTSGEVAYRSLKITLTSGGPGVFLAVFGAYILVAVLGQKVELTTENSAPEVKGTSLVTGNGRITPTAFIVNAQPAGAVLPPAPLAKLDTEISPCAIRKTSKKLFTGSHPLSPSEIKATFDLVLQDLNEREAEISPRQGEYRKAITTITELRKNIDE